MFKHSYPLMTEGDANRFAFSVDTVAVLIDHDTASLIAEFSSFLEADAKQSEIAETENLAIYAVLNNKPDHDYIIVWKGFGNPSGSNCQWDSKARVRIWQREKTIVVLSDLDTDETGTSIVNCAEGVCTLVRDYFGLEGSIRWLQHFPYHNQLFGTKPEISEVFFSLNASNHYVQPRWKHIKVDEAKKMIGNYLTMDRLPPERYIYNSTML